MKLGRSCPRKGIAWLTDLDGERVAIETTCKLKKCPVCQVKLTSLFTMMVEYRLRFSTQDPFYFTTLTYRAGKNLQRDAESVRDTWRALLLRWRSRYPKLTWIRVVELTKRGQPHLHIIMSCGPGNRQARCERRAKYDASWLAKDCACLEHVFSKEWREITGDSYVVDVVEVADSGRGASYLAKYVAKAFGEGEVFRLLGFHRSWSRSRSWRVERFQLETTVKDGWSKVEFGGPRDNVWPADGSIRNHLKRGEMSSLRRRVGTDLARALAHEVEDRAWVSGVKRRLKQLNESSQKHDRIIDERRRGRLRVRVGADSGRRPVARRSR